MCPKIWVTGRLASADSSSSLHITAVSMSTLDAESFCEKDSDFVAPLEAGSKVPGWIKEWKGLYFPSARKQKASALDDEEDLSS